MRPDSLGASIADRWPIGLLGVMFLFYAGLGIRSYIRRYHRKPPSR